VPPTIDGTMPLGFREENLRNPLSRVSSYHYRSPSASRIPYLSDCVKKTGRAQRIHDEDPNPQIKFDNQLYTAADYLMCMVVGPGAPGGTINR